MGSVISDSDLVYMITLKSCPICKSSLIAQYPYIGIQPRVLHEIMPGVKTEAGIISYYFLCQNCHLIFQSPRLSNAELDRFYGQGYYRRIVGKFDKQMDEGEKRRAKVDLEIIKKQIGIPASHLDIGCGRGYLLEAVGAKIKVGVESDVSYVRVKGIKVYSDINKVPQKSFDLVSSVHVLEHVPYPLEYLKSIRRFVKNSGYLFLEVPTRESKGGPLRLQHLYFFENDVLKSVCSQAGFSVIQIGFTPHLVLICKKI